MTVQIINPFRPGAGHQPPYLAGRDEDKVEYLKLLEQEIVMKNLILTGLRGIGKTVLLESFKPLTLEANWLWAGTDCSESSTVNEETMATRLMTDIALITSGIKIREEAKIGMGFNASTTISSQYLNYEFLISYYAAVPGLPTDKLKAVLTLVWGVVKTTGVRGIVFAYDEAQTLTDHSEDKQYPLSMLLDVFQYLQKSKIPFMLILTGLPSLLIRLIETRTYTERLSKVMVLSQLNPEQSREAISRPIAAKGMPSFTDKSIDLIASQAGGYPYFIQFLCREVFDIFQLQAARGEDLTVPIDALLQKLDNDFFAGRWAKATDREKELLTAIAKAGLNQFGIQQVVNLTTSGPGKPFSKSQVSQMFGRLIDTGLVYKDRRGEYSFAVPMLEGYILRLNKISLSHGPKS